jgi:hypothetical protein
MYIEKKCKVFSILLLVEWPSRMINCDSADSVELTSLSTLVVNFVVFRMGPMWSGWDSNLP